MMQRFCDTDNLKEDNQTERWAQADRRWDGFRQAGRQTENETGRPINKSVTEIWKI